MKLLFSGVIVISLLAIILFGVFTMASRVIADSWQPQLYASLLTNCKSIERGVGDRNVVLRIDDIQANTWRDIQMRMINDAVNEGVPLLLAVIPKNLENDKKIYYFLKKHMCNIEIAQHGWDHGIDKGGDIPEFEALNTDEAYGRIINGKGVLEKLAGEDLVTFIPPNNIYSTGTAEAVKKAGFKILSSEGKGRFDYTAATFDYDTNSLDTLEHIVSDCEEGWRDHGLCIIMLHPQDFADGMDINEEKYGVYKSLLSELKSRDATFITLKELLEVSEPKECDAYLHETLKLGADNNPEEVKKLQSFLQTMGGFTDLELTGVYNASTFDAVKSFQVEYHEDVLDPWGSGRVLIGTGQVHHTTKKKINEIYCGGKEFPLTEDEVSDINATKYLIETIEGQTGS